MLRHLKYYLSIAALFTIAGCGSLVWNNENAHIPPKEDSDRVYHDVISKLADAYNKSEGLLPKADVFYSIINEISTRYPDCDFVKENYALKNVKIYSPMTPDLSDNRAWNITRNWSESWLLESCGKNQEYTIDFTIQPDKAARWKINY